MSNPVQSEAMDHMVRFRTFKSLWTEYREALRILGTDPSSELRDVIRWQLGLPGAREPRRLVK